MATRLTVKAQGRAVGAEAAIRGHLADGDTKAAADEAIATLRSELVKLRKHRPADGALTDAELAGQLLALASQLHRHRPTRPAGCQRVPTPADTTRKFDMTLAQALPNGDSR